MVAVNLAFFLPDPALRTFISTFWDLEANDGVVEDMLHPEWANIRFALDEPWEVSAINEAPEPVGHAIIQGPTCIATRIKGSGRTFGIGILPTGWNRLWRADASKWANKSLPLETLMGADAAPFVEAIRAAPDVETRVAIANKMLLNQLDQSPGTAFDDHVEAFFQVLTDPANATVEQIGGTLGLPHARLSRLSRHGFGFPPKLLLRRQRFLRMLGTLHARPYEEWPDFIDPQYVDQSHMIRDFKRFLGLSPSQYFALERPILKAATKGRAALLGQPLQGLHLPSGRKA